MDISRNDVENELAGLTVEEVAQKAEDEESGDKRNLTGKIALAAGLLSCAFGIFQLITGGYRPLTGIVQPIIHLGASMILMFLYYPARKKSVSHVTIVDIVMVGLSVALTIYVLTQAHAIMNMELKNNVWQVIFGIAIIALVIEASRRTIGLIFPILVGAFLAYALLGHLIPGMFGHPYLSYQMIVRNIYVDAQGMWGNMMQMSATLLGLFLTFGAVLLRTGGGEAFLDVGYFLSARSRGGSAKVATITSGLFGMISGSCTANAATIGTFTIPLMKKGGYSPEFAAATEGVAGTGGMIMPPIMGAAAFLMAQFLGISYLSVALCAIIPAVLYYISLFSSIQFTAIKDKMEIPDKSEFEARKKLFSIRKTILPLVPIIILIIGFISGITVQYAAFIAALFAIVLMFFTMDGEWKPSRFVLFVKRLYGAFAGAGTAIALCAVLLGCAQIMISVLGLTGLAIKFSNVIVSLGESSLFLTLVLGMVMLFLLGMGVPVTAVYVVGAAIVTPAFILLGIDPLSAHMFTFYFSCMGAITPPVCGAIFVTSSIAKSNWWKSGWLAVRLALPGFIVPYVFVYKSTLLLVGSPSEIIPDVLTALLGVVLLSAGTVGFMFSKCSIFERILFITSGILFVIPNMMTAAMAAVLLVVVLVIQLRKRKAEKHTIA